MAREKVGDIMFAPPDDPLCIGVVSVVNPWAGASCSRVDREDGSAAVVRDVQKRNAYRAYDPGAYDFVPLSHETHGRLGRPATARLNQLQPWRRLRLGVVWWAMLCW